MVKGNEKYIFIVIQMVNSLCPELSISITIKLYFSFPLTIISKLNYRFEWYINFCHSGNFYQLHNPVAQLTAFQDKHAIPCNSNDTCNSTNNNIISIVTSWNSKVHNQGRQVTRARAMCTPLLPRKRLFLLLCGSACLSRNAVSCTTGSY